MCDEEVEEVRAWVLDWKKLQGLIEIRARRVSGVRRVSIVRLEQLAAFVEPVGLLPTLFSFPRHHHTPAHNILFSPHSGSGGLHVFSLQVETPFGRVGPVRHVLI